MSWGQWPRQIVLTGVLAIVLGLCVVAAAAVAVGVSFAGLADASKPPAADLLVEIDVPGRTAVDLEAGTSHDLVATGTRLVSTRARTDRLLTPDTQAPAVTLVQPGGEPVRIDEPISTTTSTAGDTQVVVIGTFDVPESGSYELRARPVSGVDRLGIGDGVDTGLILGFGLLGGVALICGLVLAAGGLVLLLGGLAWLAIDRSTGARAAT